jgi:hypothetical protein
MSPFQWKFFIVPVVFCALTGTNAASGEESLNEHYEIIQLGNGFSREGSEIDASAVQQEILPVQPFQSLTSELRAAGRRSPATGRRTAALRIAEEGRAFLQNQRPEKALTRLETSMALEANPYIYYYLALAHARLGHYRYSLGFLDVAETWLGRDPAWAAEISQLRNSNGRALETALRNDLAKIDHDPGMAVEKPTAIASRLSEPEPPLFPPELFFPLLFFFFLLGMAWVWNRPAASRALRSQHTTGPIWARQLDILRHKQNLRARKWSV